MVHISAARRERAAVDVEHDGVLALDLHVQYDYQGHNAYLI